MIRFFAALLLIPVGFSCWAQSDSVKIEVTNLGSHINSDYSDFAPVISADGSMMIYTSRRAIKKKAAPKKKATKKKAAPKKKATKKKAAPKKKATKKKAAPKKAAAPKAAPVMKAAPAPAAAPMMGKSEEE